MTEDPITATLLRLLTLLGLLWAPSTAFGDDPTPAPIREVAASTHLRDYVTRPDPAFAYAPLETRRLGEGASGHIVRLTSQTWRDKTEVAHPTWTHMLQIVRPAQVTSSTALLVISGGRRTDTAPGELDRNIVALAKATGMVTVLLPNTPNQPQVIFERGRDEQKKRHEDDLVAQSWVKALETGDPEWVIQLAMVKAAVAAMDATQAFMREPGEGAGPVEIDAFVVAGASKRGWTTWLTAAVDERVSAIVPIVIDTLNLPETMRHHWEAYGFWAPAIGDYSSRGLQHELSRGDGGLIRRIVDPYLYREQLTMPKLMLNSAGDQFFLPDTTRYYLDGLKGLTRLRYMPNTDHGLDFKGRDGEPTSQSALESLAGFTMLATRGLPVPELRWTRRGVSDTRASLAIECDTAPQRVTLWVAHNPAARDFRQEAIGDAWKPTALASAGDNPLAYSATIGIDPRGYTAYLIEAYFQIPGQPTGVTFTTPVFITPDTLPFAGRAME